MVGPVRWHPRCSHSRSRGCDPRSREEKALLRLIIMALLVLPASVAWAAECAPEKMVRIVTRDATPGIDPQSFPALPKTLYRLGNGRGRVEEMPDASRGVHGLIVVNEPDAWIVNLHDKSGRHVVDPGPGLIFRAPILDGGGELPAPLRELEFGCELAPEFELAERRGQLASSIEDRGPEDQAWTGIDDMPSRLVMQVDDPRVGLVHDDQAMDPSRGIGHLLDSPSAVSEPVQGLWESGKGLRIDSRRGVSSDDPHHLLGSTLRRPRHGRGKNEQRHDDQSKQRFSPLEVSDRVQVISSGCIVGASVPAQPFHVVSARPKLRSPAGRQKLAAGERASSAPARRSREIRLTQTNGRTI